MSDVAVSSNAIFAPGTSDAEIEELAAKAARQRKHTVLFYCWFSSVFGRSARA
jgi:NitT/TauT family transport system permease protein